MFLDALRSRWVTALAWVAGGAAFMYVVGIACVSEVDTFPGGAPAVGASLEAAAQAMRLLRWPAERLDTFGGYVTYHNVTILTLAMGLWAGIQGAHTLRGPNAEPAVELMLAAGVPRRTLVRARVGALAVTIWLIAAGIGLGLAAAMAATGVPDLAGSMGTVAAVALTSSACLGLGLVVAEANTGPSSAPGTPDHIAWSPSCRHARLGRRPAGSARCAGDVGAFASGSQRRPGRWRPQQPPVRADRAQSLPVSARVASEAI